MTWTWTWWMWIREFDSISLLLRISYSWKSRVVGKTWFDIKTILNPSRLTSSEHQKRQHQLSQAKPSKSNGHDRDLLRLHDLHIQRVTARTALAWKIHSRQVQIPKHTADLFCLCVCLGCVVKLRMNWHTGIEERKSEIGCHWTCKIWFIWTDGMISKTRQTPVNCRAHRPPRPRPPKLWLPPIFAQFPRATGQVFCTFADPEGFHWGIIARHATEAPVYTLQMQRMKLPQRENVETIRYSIFDIRYSFNSRTTRGPIETLEPSTLKNLEKSDFCWLAADWMRIFIRWSDRSWGD
jgi:hypothetical protein